MGYGTTRISVRRARHPAPTGEGRGEVDVGAARTKPSRPSAANASWSRVNAAYAVAQGGIRSRLGSGRAREASVGGHARRRLDRRRRDAPGYGPQILARSEAASRGETLRLGGRSGWPISTRRVATSRLGGVPSSSSRRTCSTGVPPGFVIVLPMTSTIRGVPSHVPVSAPEGRREEGHDDPLRRDPGVGRAAGRSLGRGRAPDMAVVEDRLRILLRL